MDGFERSNVCASPHSQASFTPMRQVRRVTEMESIVHISELCVLCIPLSVVTRRMRTTIVWMTSLQKRTAETPRAQRTLKTNHDGCTAQRACA